ncbi:MAG: hypothetical protein PHR77_12380 [Kiritimatiellae bacterium]|nr:hypothetical protein [Kiritimatiellia bacterium]MDD5519507.1 hypothetical protein [Kiritimatiellia bacterium]
MRIRLLGHYLSKMVTLMHAAEQEEQEIKARFAVDARVSSTTTNALPIDLSSNNETIVTYLKKVGSASAKEINRYGGIAKSSMFRHLRELTKNGIIGKTGTNKRTRYRLVKIGGKTPEKNQRNAVVPPQDPLQGCMDYCI